MTGNIKCTEYLHSCFKKNFRPCEGLKAEILRLVKEGIPLTRCLEIYLIDPGTYAKWKELAMRGDNEMLTFHHELQKGEASFEIDLIRKAKQHPASAAKLLASRFPDRWHTYEPSPLLEVTSKDLMVYLDPQSNKKSIPEKVK
jgi:hypothetical protein